MNIVIGLVLGIAVGALQIFLLTKFLKGITEAAKPGENSDSVNTSAYMISGFAQLLIPFAVLIAVAFIYRDALLWTGIGAGTSLIILGVIKFIVGRKEG